MLVQAGRYAEAAHEFEQVDRFLEATGQRVGFDPVVYRFLLAICYAHLGKGEAARKWFDQAMKDSQFVFSADPQSTSIDWWLRLLLQSLKQEAETSLSDLKPPQEQME